MDFRYGSYIFLMLAGAASYGLTPIAVKLAYDAGLSAGEVTNAQYEFAALILWLIALPTLRGGRWPQGRDWPLLAGIGLSAAGTSVCYYVALTRLPASLAIMMLFQFAWMVMVIESIARRTRPTLAQGVGMALIVVGTVPAAGLIGTHIAHLPLGAAALGLMAGVLYATTLSLSGRVRATSSPALRAAITVSLATLAILPVFPPGYPTSGVRLDRLLEWGLLAALLGQAIPMLSMLIAIPRIGGRMAGVLGAIELPVAVLAARAILDEPVTATRWLGVVLIVAGIGVSEWKR